MRHAAGEADSAADHIDLIPTVLKQAEAFDAVGFGDKLFDEGNHLFPWKAMDAVEHNRVGTQLGGQVLLTFIGGVGEQVVLDVYKRQPENRPQPPYPRCSFPRCR